MSGHENNVDGKLSEGKVNGPTKKQAKKSKTGAKGGGAQPPKKLKKTIRPEEPAASDSRMEFALDLKKSCKGGVNLVLKNELHDTE